MPLNAMSHYPGGFSHGLTVRDVPILTTHAGNIWWVDSGAGSDSGGADGSFNRPFAGIDYANGRCTANNGDFIIAKPGHVDTVSTIGGLDLDVAGVTVIFLGNGTDRAYVNFTTAVGADMDIDAANVTLVNFRGVAGIDALTGPIDVNSANFRMVGDCRWEDGTTINTTDCVVADANADEMTIDGFTFIDGNAAGTQKQSFIQVAGATRPTIRNIRATGDFGTGIIENGTAWVDATLEDLILDNASVTPTVCVLLQATSSGWARNSSLRVASGATGYTANNDMQFDNVTTTGTDAASTEGADGTLGVKADTAATGAVTTTDTGMAYIKQLVTQNGVELDTDTLGALLAGTGGIATMPNAAVPAANVNVFELLRSIWGNQCGTAAGENGIATFPAAALPANSVSIAEVLRETYDQSDKSVTNTTGVLATGTTLFTIAGGPIEILSLVARCVVGGDAQAATLQWSADPTDGAAATFSGASASLANAAAGAMVILLGTALTTAPTVTTTGVGLSMSGATPTLGIIVGAGIITSTVGSGPTTTGTWQHHLRYRPLARGVTVS